MRDAWRRYRSGVTRQRGRLRTYVFVVVLATVTCSGLCGGTAWLFFHGVTDCSAVVPDGLTESDLYGTYVSSDGGRLTLDDDRTFEESHLRAPDAFASTMSDVTGTWFLQEDPPAHGEDEDIVAQTGYDRVYIGVAGSRAHPWLYLTPDAHDRCGLYRLTRQR